HRVAPGAEVLARVDDRRVLVEVRAQRGRQRVVEVRRDVDLRHPGLDGAREVGVGDARRAVQHERHGHGGAQLRDAREVERRGAVRHRVRRTDGHGERVHARRVDELDRLGRVGAHAGRVHAVLAADLAELGLDEHADGARLRDDLGRRGDVVLVVERGAVVHDGREPELDRLGDEVAVLGVVEVHDDRHLGGARDGQRRRGDGLEPAVPAGGVLADLQHDAGADLGGRGDERLGVLDLDDVERPDAAPLGAGRAEQVVGGDEGHQDSGAVTTWVSRRSTSARSTAPATGCRTAAAEVAAASARRCAQGWSGSTASAAMAASPAPVGLPATGAARRARPTTAGLAGPSGPASYAVRPRSPSVTTAARAPRRRSSPAARAGSSTPVAWRGSDRWGLTRSAPASAAHTRPGPETSTWTRAPAARSAPTSPTTRSRVVPGGSEPETVATTAAGAVPTCATHAATSAAHSASSSAGPGSLSTVGCPPSSAPASAGTTATDWRTAPATGTTAAGCPSASRSSAKGPASGPPRGHTATLGDPRART